MARRFTYLSACQGSLRNVPPFQRSRQTSGYWKTEKLLPTRAAPKRVKHCPALTELPEFMADRVSAGALEFTILTAARTSEVIAAWWSEIDLDSGVWTVSAERMRI